MRQSDNSAADLARANKPQPVYTPKTNYQVREAGTASYNAARASIIDKAKSK